MAKTAIGLDIGGTKMNGIVYDGKQIARQLTVATPKDLEHFEAVLTKLLSFLSSGKNITAVGMGVAGVISPNTGQVVYCPNMKFLLGWNPEKFLKAKKFRSVRVENDANCFAVAESYIGKGKIFKNMVGVTLGTGIGGGIIINKKLYSGMRHSAGEAGHIMADFKYDSEHYYKLARDSKDYRTLGQVVGILFANIINFLDIEALVLGGSIATTKGKQFLPFAISVARQHVVNKTHFPKILISSLKHGGSLGAALLAME